MMYLTVKQQIKHLSKTDYLTLRELCHIAKNLMNEAIYAVRQHFFEEQTYLNYYKVYDLLKHSENYKLLNSNMSQQILKEVDGSFASFFGLLKLAKEGKYNTRDCKLPKYLPKDGFTTLVIGFVRLKDNTLLLPFSRAFRKTHQAITIHVPPILADKKIKEIRIIPKVHARFFEIQYTYEAECVQRNRNKNHALAIDLGVDNLITAVTNSGRAFIIDGKRLKSINQWFNKRNARLQRIKDKQSFGKAPTNAQRALARRRNNKVNDYLSKAAKMVINYCVEHDIGTLVVGYHKEFQRKYKLGKVNNQNFVNLPLGKLVDKFRYLCELNGISLVLQEESYTSKASFWDRDDMPVYGADNDRPHVFSGKRVARGLYRTAHGKCFNADVNGELNILRKSNVVSLEALYTRGDVDTPVRIRVA